MPTPLPSRPARWRGLHADGAARLGILETRRGAVRTPAFAPVGTRGAIKGLLCRDLPRDGFDLVLANTYHLMLRPGTETVAALGGVHALLDWPGPVLTDSGGFQVYSLAALRDIHDDGVVIQNHIDGAPLRLTPANVVAAQEALGSDIAMVLDVCPALPAGADEVRRAVELSAAWARLAADARRDEGMALFGIVQGGTDPELRRQSARATVDVGFDGYALGGLSVGEDARDLYATLDAAVPALPADHVRYLMGVGRPDNLVEAVARGVDLFDCVLPTRLARHGKLLTDRGPLNVQRAEHRLSDRPVEEGCACLACTTASRGILRHFFKVNELNYFTLASSHNLHYMARLMARIRAAIAAGALDELRAEVVAYYADEPTPTPSEDA